MTVFRTALVIVQNARPFSFNQQLLREAYYHITQSGTLFVSVEDTDATSLPLSEFLALLHRYYQYLTDISQDKDILFDSCVLLPFNGIKPAQNALLSAELEAVFHSADDVACVAGLVSINESRRTAGLAELAVCPIQTTNTLNAEEKEAVQESEEVVAGGLLRLYSHVVLGGTFDHLHLGHKVMLTTAALIATHTLVIGLSDDELLVRKQHREYLEAYSVREAHLRHFLNAVHPGLVVDIEPLHDIYGPSTVRAELQALVVSEETKAGGELVNKKRIENGHSVCDIVVIPLVDHTHQASAKIGSTFIRQTLKQQQQEANYLQTSWHTLCQSVGVGEALAREWWQKIVAAYSEPHRFYHTLHHLYQLLQLYEGVSGSLSGSVQSIIQFSIWFHDMVYHTQAASHTAAALSNEQLSAQLFCQFADAAALAPKVRAQVEVYILATQTHQLPHDDDQGLKYFLDMDLSILGTSPPEYKRYSELIRKEYVYLDIATYRAGRSAVLTKFLQRPTLFFSDLFRERFENTARENLREEIQILSC